MIISLGAEKTFDKIQHAFMIKNTQRARNRRKLPQHDGKTPQPNITLKDQ